MRKLPCNIFELSAMIWSQEPIDLFDTRTRTWYIEAASSPKDIVILVDRSGSMTGMRREIARHVVHNILDTLSNNDYVNIFTFSNTTDPLVECFDNRLVQVIIHYRKLSRLVSLGLCYLPEIKFFNNCSHLKVLHI